jgi:uncharacterized protein YjbI with pentapeptide repeats
MPDDAHAITGQSPEQSSAEYDRRGLLFRIAGLSGNWFRRVANPTADESDEMPITFAAYEVLRNNVTEAARHARNLFSVHLTVSLYAILTLATMKDTDFFSYGHGVKLPIVNLEVSAAFYLPGIAALSVLVFLHLQFYLQHMWLLVAQVKQRSAQHATNPGFVPETHLFRHPWIGLVSSSDGRWNALAGAVLGIVHWGAAPTVFLLCWLRAARCGGTLQHLLSSGLPWGLPFGCAFIAATIALPLWSAWYATLRGRRPRIAARFAISLAMLIVGAGGWFGATRYELQLAHARIQGFAAELTFRGANLEGSNLKDTNLEGANLERAVLRHANLDGARLDGANLERANLRETKLNDASLGGVNLKRALVIGADLTGADLTGADLADANLNGANLNGADLGGTNLQGAFLGGANLEGADLGSAKLGRTTVLWGANLRGANLEGADLEDVELRGVCYDKRTRFSAEFVLGGAESDGCEVGKRGAVED